MSEHFLEIVGNSTVHATAVNSNVYNISTRISNEANSNDNKILLSTLYI